MTARAPLFDRDGWWEPQCRAFASLRSTSGSRLLLLHSWLLSTAGWTAYCVFDPRLEETRWEALFGARFRDYRASVPYFLPRFRR
ncbi:MAG: hypothetical protein FJ265_23255 [Planctomycetes bacterium]|nr:hypothetical protein [Planctomycetota bacterium]